MKKPQDYAVGVMLTCALLGFALICDFSWQLAVGYSLLKLAGGISKSLETD